MAPDAVYGNASRPNATMTDWARANRLTTARYPAGEASYWNWEDPSGVMGRSTLDPSFNDSERAPAYEWMGLDEYLDLCEAAALDGETLCSQLDRACVESSAHPCRLL